MDFKQTLQNRLVASLDPELQERYRKRREEAVRQQEQNFQPPEAAEALADGQRTRALLGGLARAANKFGSVMGDGGPKTSVGETLDAFNEADKSAFALKQQAYDRAVRAEEGALEGMSDSISTGISQRAGMLKLADAEADAAWLDAPVNDYTRTAAEGMLEKAGMGGKVPWDRIKNRDLERNPFLKSVVTRAEKASEGKPVYQKLRDADGVVRVYAVYPDGTKSPVGDAGFAQQVRTDPATGNLITVDPNRPRGASGNPGRAVSGPAAPSGSARPAAGGVDANLQPGETPKQRDVRVGLEVERQKEGIKSEAKKEAELGEATTEQYRVGELSKRLRKLRDGAALTGPIGGRIGQTLNEFGISAGKADELNQALSKELSDYIKATTGASATESEMKRLEKFIPSTKDDDTLFNNKLQGLEETIQGLVNEKLTKRRGAPAVPSQRNPSQKSMRAEDLP